LAVFRGKVSPLLRRLAQARVAARATENILIASVVEAAAGELMNVIVVGASAGGLDALVRLVSQLPAKLPAAVMVVQHMSADASADVLVSALQSAAELECSEARNGAPIKAGHIYVAPADQHLLLSGRKMLVTKGARENRSRPGIDPLFRSAAVAHGNRTIGVLLTGQLDDGTAGLIAIKRCGGTCVVQDPRDAAYPAMPSNALHHAEVDHCVPIAAMGALLGSLLKKQPKKLLRVPKDVAIEARIAERVLSDLESVNALGKQVPFNCPGCGGVLWEVTAGKGGHRYRCHTGHSYTASVLLAEQAAKIEETLWVALRMFEERRNLLSTVAKAKRGAAARAADERARESSVHVERIRAMLNATAK
jgi:two-component system chemotaxis response regulator CheB